MIVVGVLKQHNLIQSIEVKGHANSGTYGKDLVCAGVSTIMFGLCNAFDLFDNNATIQILDNCISITNISSDATIQMIAQTGLIQLKTLQETATNYLKIEEKRCNS